MPVGTERAVQILRGAKHETPTAGDVARQCANLDAVRGSVRRCGKCQRAGSEHSGTHHKAKCLPHVKILLLRAIPTLSWDGGHGMAAGPQTRHFTQLSANL